MYLYRCKFPHKGGIWHKVEAKNIGAARRKFTKGSRYKPSEVKCKRVKKGR